MSFRPRRITTTEQKIVDWPMLQSHREQARADGRIVVWTNGCFDLLHAGHVYGLQVAANYGDLLVVGLNSDSSVKQLKGMGRPVVPQQQRAIMLSALACVDFVVLFDDLTPEPCIDRLRPDVHCKGSEYAPPEGAPIPEADLVRSYGGRIEFVPRLPTDSTTDLITWIRTQPLA
jgi:D-glycero-beta-D-manno-heptose 1-phosphate adenylyltransferase